MEEIVQEELENWNSSEEMIMVLTPVGVKPVPLVDVGPESSCIEGVLRVHLIHSFKKKL